MRKLNEYGVASILMLCLWIILSSSSIVLAQNQNPSPMKSEVVQREQTNFEIQLHLLIASNESSERSNVPQVLDGAVKQLKTTLPFSNYRLASTFLERVRDGGNLEVSGVGGFPLTTTPANTTTPTFFNFNLNRVTLVRGADDQFFIQTERFRFGLKVPIQTASVRSEGSNASYPVIQYQDIGILTDISIREGVPTVIGTLASSQPDQSFVLLLTLKRAAAR